MLQNSVDIISKKSLTIYDLYYPPTLTFNYLFRLLKSFNITNFDDIDLDYLLFCLESSKHFTYKRKLLLFRLKELKCQF